MAFLQPRIIFIAIFFFLSLVSSTPVKLPSGSSAAVTNHISVFRGIVSRGGDAKRPKYEDYVPNKTTDRVVTLVYRSDRRAPSAITGGLAQVCQKIFRPMGLSSTGKTKAPAQCTKIHTIHIDLSLSNAEGAGTYDQIAGTLEGPAGTAKFVFATKPWGNSKFTVSVKAKDSFNTDEINLNSIKRLNITAQGLIGFLPLYNDKFQVQDIKLRAECVDPLYRAQVNRYIGINQWMQHPAAEQTIAWPPYEPGVERVVATFDIRHRDWLFSTSCKEVKDINYELKVANVEGAGTYDKVWFTLGDKDDKEPKQTVVGYGLTAGDIKKGSVGSNEEIVPLSHLKQVAISEEHRWFRPFANTWTFESIIFTATCASSGQKLLMDKYDWIHANLYRVDDTPVWTGDFSAWDWLEVHGK